MKKILVVDDQTLVLKMVTRMLNSVEGVDVLALTTSEAAIRVCAARAPADLYAVISDFDLGFGSPNGLQVLAAAPPVGTIRVLMSGDLPVHCYPADHTLEKPFSRGELLLALGLLDTPAKEGD